MTSAIELIKTGNLHLIKKVFYPIVVVGASIGSIESLKTFFSLLSDSPNMSFFIASHLDTSIPTDFPKFIKLHSKLTVKLIENNEECKLNHVYINPPNKHTILKNGRFLLENSEQPLCTDLPINSFVNSLIQEKHEKTAVVILSGYIPLCPSLLKDIRKESGIVIAQDPKTTQFNNMALNAINNSCVDYVLSADKIPAFLIKHFDNSSDNIHKSLINNSTVLPFKNTPDSNFPTLINEFNNYQIELELQNEQLNSVQEDLLEANKRYIDLYEFAPIGYFTLNENGLIKEVNQAGADLLGFEKKFLINRSFSRYISPEFQDTYSSHRQSVLNNKSSQTCEIKLMKRKDSLFYAQLHSRVLMNNNGEKELLTFITDISEQKRDHEILYQNQIKIANTDKMASMIKLTSLIVHEINHPLGAISNFVNGCIKRLKANNYKPEELTDVLEKVAGQTQRIGDIILRMRNFSCKNNMEYDFLSVNTIIEETIKFIKYEMLEFPISINFRSLNYSPPVKVDKFHFQQVLINLARNAIEAMQDSKISEPKLTIEANLSPNWIEIMFTDNGPGISDEVASKLFNLNFTTKSYGIGIGLAVCRAIIEEHGGQLTYLSRLGEGTCFIIKLPYQKMENAL